MSDGGVFLSIDLYLSAKSERDIVKSLYISLALGADGFHGVDLLGAEAVKLTVLQLLLIHLVGRKCKADVGADYLAVDLGNDGVALAVKQQIDSVCDIQNVPCHNDPLCENWVLSADDDRLYLIDWEYAGMNDGIWDLADVSIEGVFTPENDELLLTEYLGSKPDQNEYKHFLANKIYVDYLWTLWAKTRVPYDGQPMEDWAVERYARLKDNLRLFAEA